MKVLVVILVLWTSALYAHTDVKNTPVPAPRDPLAVNLDWFLDDEELMEFVPMLNEHLDALTKGKKEADDVKLLRKVFYRTHAKFLQSYEKYVPMGAILPKEGGAYDCLTATALYAIMLDKLGYKYSIQELEYHVYLMVHLPSGDILIESTDPYGGFETSSEKIEKRRMAYSQISIETYNSYVGEDIEQVNLLPEINNAISLKELAGLLYYNLAVREFNTGQYQAAKLQLEKAQELYDCPRVRGLMEITLANLSGGISMR